MDVEEGRGGRFEVERRAARTRALRGTLSPRWIEAFASVVPELPERLAAGGSGVAAAPGPVTGCG